MSLRLKLLALWLFIACIACVSRKHGRHAVEKGSIKSQMWKINLKAASSRRQYGNYVFFMNTGTPLTLSFDFSSKHYVTV